MSITSISALSGGFNFTTSPYTAPPASTRSSIQLANGSTVTIVRGSTGDVLAVTTAVAAAQSLGPQEQSSTFYITA